MPRPVLRFGGGENERARAETGSIDPRGGDGGGAPLGIGNREEEEPRPEGRPGHDPPRRARREPETLEHERSGGSRAEIEEEPEAMPLHAERELAESRKEEASHDVEEEQEREARKKASACRATSGERGRRDEGEDEPLRRGGERRVGEAVRGALAEVHREGEEERRGEKEGDGADPDPAREPPDAGGAPGHERVGREDPRRGGSHEEMGQEHRGERRGRSAPAAGTREPSTDGAHENQE